MDKVFVDTLQLAAQVGSDCWGRPRSQQISLSIYLYLSPLFLERAGISDDVEHSVHYGHLTKSITQLVQADGAAFISVDDLIDRVAVQAFELAGGSVVEVRVVVDLPKLILLASGFEVDVTLPSRRKIVCVKDLVLFVIIGVNAPEREAKQRVIVNISFVEKVGTGSVDYAQIVDAIQTRMEATQYLTLEKFVLETVRLACVTSVNIQAATVRAQKPSALSFAHSSGVEITREQSHFTM
ncbi:tetrahydrobiopterin biosynthesis enzymes-like protein [Pleurotus eryngii]|uniref:dihydroneopterin aldolase n=1 Tax=Pleurotus eryngii TaxID=5323 RepID=A0A9P6DD10_PLEER|nr:tetrahydrobiopterin biosynthesis enzymes-like protein [Pleurotus eryngii]